MHKLSVFKWLDLLVTGSASAHKYGASSVCFQFACVQKVTLTLRPTFASPKKTGQLACASGVARNVCVRVSVSRGTGNDLEEGLGFGAFGG